MDSSPSHRSVLAAGVVATATNVAVHAAARAADVPLLVRSGDEVSAVPVLQVALASAVPILIGGAVLGAARSRGRTRLVALLAVASTVLSLGAPLAMGVGAATKLTLVIMHLVAGAGFLAASRAVDAAAPVSGRRARTATVAG